jgi:hypothetical protein
MNKFSIILFVFIAGCNSNEIRKDLKVENTLDSLIVNSSETESKRTDSIAVWYEQSQIEQDQFNEKYQFKWSTLKLKEPNKFPWKTGNKILVYYVAGEGEKQATWECRTSGGKEITQEQYAEYCTVLNDPESYNNTTASCFIPSLAIVVYDGENIPMEYSEVCFDCNKIITVPYEIDFNFSDTDFYGISSKARATLREMFAEWGVPYESYSDSWDHESK